MKLRILAATLFVALSARSAESPLPQLRIEPTTGGSIFYVKNVSSQPLTAYLIELVDYPGSSYILWQDEIGAEAISPAGVVPDPILPGKEKRIQVGNMTVGAVPDYVKVQAAIYADGSTAGVREKVAQLVQRHKFTMETVRQTIQRLEKARETKMPKDELINNLNEAAGLMQPKKGGEAQTMIDHAAGSRVLWNTAGQLGKHSMEETLAALRKVGK